jgi:hypothetical protein
MGVSLPRVPTYSLELVGPREAAEEVPYFECSHLLRPGEQIEYDGWIYHVVEIDTQKPSSNR